MISIRQFCKISISIKYRIDSNLAYRTGLQPGRPCLDTSVGTSGSGGLFQPGQGQVDLFVTGGSWHRNESNKEQFVKPGESDGRPSEF